MDILLIFKIVCAVGTVGVGVISLVAPRSIKGFTGLEATGPRGITEIRAVLGALFIGIGIAPFLLGNAPAVYQALGIMYLAVGLVRAISMVLDKSIMPSNTISLIVEIIFGVILVL
jgi:hypothetical protein